MIDRLTAADKLQLFSQVPVTVVKSSSCRRALVQQLTDACCAAIERCSESANTYTVAELLQLVCLPPPRRICFVVVCLSVSNFMRKLPNGFAWNFQGRWAVGQWTNDEISMAIRITVWIQGLFSGFVTIGRYGKWWTDINLLLVVIWQMAALVTRALVEVCTVPVLVVYGM